MKLLLEDIAGFLLLCAILGMIPFFFALL